MYERERGLNGSGGSVVVGLMRGPPGVVAEREVVVGGDGDWAGEQNRGGGEEISCVKWHLQVKNSNAFLSIIR